MAGRTVLFFSAELAQRFDRELAACGAYGILGATPTVVAPPDERAWVRAVSELALFNWLLLPTEQAAEALLDATGAPPASTLRVATVAPAGEVLRAVGRAPDIEAQGLRALCDRLDGHLGRRERILVPHAAVAGRALPGWLIRLGADPLCVAAYELEGGDQPEAAEGPVVAVLGNPLEAEALASRGLPRGLLVAALTVGTADAAEDCGLTALAMPPERLGAFLGEALS